MAKKTYKFWVPKRCMANNIFRLFDNEDYASDVIFDWILCSKKPKKSDLFFADSTFPWKRITITVEVED